MSRRSILKGEKQRENNIVYSCINSPNANIIIDMIDMLLPVLTVLRSPQRGRRFRVWKSDRTGSFGVREWIGRNVARALRTIDVAVVVELVHCSTQHCDRQEIAATSRAGHDRLPAPACVTGCRTLDDGVTAQPIAVPGRRVCLDRRYLISGL